MGSVAEPDFEETKFICTQILRGRSDRQIQGDLEDWGGRHKRTISRIRMIFEAAQEVLAERLSQMRDLPGTPSKEEVERTREIVEKMSQGLRPIKDPKTGEIRYESWLEF